MFEANKIDIVQWNARELLGVLACEETQPIKSNDIFNGKLSHP